MFGLRHALLFSCLALPLGACTVNPARQSAPDIGDTTSGPEISGFREAVLSVGDLDGYRHFFSTVGGWEEFHQGRTPVKLLRLWGLPSGVSAREVMMRNPGSESGYLRLVHFQGAEQRPIRSNDQSWDTGGIFDFNVRVKNLEQLAEQMEAAGWQGVTDPAQFRLGPFEVKEWLGRGPDGVRLAMIERISPPLEGWPNLRKLSRIFNSTQIVRDIDAALAFYRDLLGFQVYLEHHGVSEQEGPNVLGLPHNLAASITRHLYILHPQKGNEGSVEILSYDGATGADFAARAKPPNRGMLMLRFPVRDARALARRLQAQGAQLEFGPVRLKLAPYGECQLFGLRAPEGAWLEFFSVVK